MCTYVYIYIYISQFSRSVLSDSVTPWTAAGQASLSITNSWSLLKLMSMVLVMPSNHLIISSSSPPTFNLSPSTFNLIYRYIIKVYMLSNFSHVQLFVTLLTIACQAPLSMGLSRQEYWIELSCPPHTHTHTHIYKYKYQGGEDIL